LSSLAAVVGVCAAVAAAAAAVVVVTDPACRVKTQAAGHRLKVPLPQYHQLLMRLPLVLVGQTSQI
jgi:hypothetical protein